ncbi:FAD-binding protein [Candidatus Babeliales bacterium]|nr:FAD-binding protein [Candidatus Babeliales bacterium]
MDLGLQNCFANGIIEQDIPLHDKNWFKTGGNARFFSQPTSTKDFQVSLQFAQNNSLPTFVFGSGANLLVSDSGFNGIAVHPNMQNVHFVAVSDKKWLVTVETGVLIDDLIVQCLERGLVGLEPFSGIPGTIGGAVFINLHYFSARIGQSFVQGQVINRTTGDIHTLDRDAFKFGYNDSILHNKNYYLLNATFEVQKVSELEIAYTRGRRDEIIRQRNSRYPRERTCGSFFRNFHKHELEMGNEKAIHPYIAYYLDKSGVKGSLRSGGAVVSHKHANMLITDRDDATSNNIVSLARKMQEIILKEFGLVPQLECQLLGFETYPLLST